MAINFDIDLSLQLCLSFCEVLLQFASSFLLTSLFENRLSVALIDLDEFSPFHSLSNFRFDRAKQLLQQTASLPPHLGQDLEEMARAGEECQVQSSGIPHKRETSSQMTVSMVPGTVDANTPKSGGKGTTVTAGHADDSDGRTSSGTVAPARSFVKFRELPPEIREKIWEEAIPRRVITPSTVSIRRLGHDYGLSCPNGHRHRAPGLQPRAVSQACWESRAVARRAMREVSMGGGVCWPVAGRAAAAPEAPGRSFPFSQANDTLHINWHAIDQGSRFCGPAGRQDALAVATDPAVSLMIDPFGFALKPAARAPPIRPIINMVYHRYLKDRSHVFLFREMYHLCLDRDKLDGVMKQGLFSEPGESRMISVDDVETLRKYLSWFSSTPRETRRQLDGFRRRPRYQDSFCEEHEVSRTTLFKLRIADFVLESHGLDSMQGSHVVGWDGEVRREHPLVAELEIRLPEVTEVVVFELCAPSSPECSSVDMAEGSCQRVA